MAVANRSELEQQVIKALSDIASSTDTASAELTGLTIASAKEIQVDNRRAIVIFVPYRQHKRYLKVQARLIRELEKKFAGAHVVIIAQRTILNAETCKRRGEKRPISRTLTAVHNAILQDIVYPTQIVGQRIRVRQDQSKLYKVYLDPKDVREVEEKLRTFAGVYRKLTNRNVEMLFPTEE